LNSQRGKCHRHQDHQHDDQPPLASHNPHYAQHSSPRRSILSDNALDCHKASWISRYCKSRESCKMEPRPRPTLEQLTVVLGRLRALLAPPADSIRAADHPLGT
jgi:hypothetical protein